MSSFEIQGQVVKQETRTSSKGNPYIAFQVKDTANKIFELTLFGDSMEMSDKLKGQVIIKGALGSREFQDKNGQQRFGIDLRVQWIEAVKAASADKAAPMIIEEPDFGSIPF